MYHQIELIGNVGRDAELRYTPDGKPVAQFSVAVSVNKKVADGWDNQTLWVRVSCWDRAAEQAQERARKGARVFAVGTLQFDAATGSPRTYLRKDGMTAASYEMTASKIVYLDKKEQAQAAPAEQPYDEPRQTQTIAYDEGEIPF